MDGFVWYFSGCGFECGNGGSAPPLMFVVYVLIVDFV